jgi:Ribbon-helix-helix protein, copG family
MLAALTMSFLELCYNSMSSYYNSDIMDSEYLSVRLSKDDAQVIQRLHQQTGLSKSEIVKRALRSLAQENVSANEGGLFELGATRFGRYGNARRQSADIKNVVKARIDAKRHRR